MSLYRESRNRSVICGHTEQGLTLHGLPWKSQSTQEGEAKISAKLEPERGNLLIIFGQAVEGYLYCHAVDVQAVSVLVWAAVELVFFFFGFVLEAVLVAQGRLGHC